MNEFLTELRELLIKHEMEITYHSRQETMVVVSANGETRYFDTIDPVTLFESVNFKQEGKNA